MMAGWRDVEARTADWRSAHARAGDAALAAARARVQEPSRWPAEVVESTMVAWAQVAQAHYAAAGVPLQPAESEVVELCTGATYTLPGVEGVWQIGGMSTQGLGTGVDHQAELILHRIDDLPPGAA